MSMTEITPLAGWGATEPDVGWDRWHSWPHWREAEQWAMDRSLVGGALLVYRIEFYLTDAPFARIYRFARNDGGHLFTDPATGKAALDKPVDVVLDSLPPADLLDAPR